MKTNFVENVSCIWGEGVELEVLLAGEETGTPSSGLPLTQWELSCACPGCAGIQGIVSDPFPGKGRGFSGAAAPRLVGPWIAAAAASQGAQGTAGNNPPGLSIPVSPGRCIRSELGGCILL